MSLLLIPGWVLLYIATGGVHDLNTFGKFAFRHAPVYVAIGSLLNFALYAVAALIVIKAVRRLRRIRH
jgi:hypothetical protein